MQLVGVKHRGGATLEVTHRGPLFSHDQGALKLAGIARVDAEVGGELHRAFHTFGNEHERAIAENSRIKSGEIVVVTGHHGAEIALNQLRVLLHRLADRAENHAMFSKLFLVGRGDRNAVEHRIHGHIGEALLLAERNTKFVERFEQLGINLVKAGFFLLLLRRCVINNVLIIDRWITESSPVGLAHLQPLPISPQAKIEQESGFLLFARNQAHHVLAEALGDLFGFDIGDEAVLIRLAHQITNSLCVAHGLKVSPRNALSRLQGRWSAARRGTGCLR